MERCRGSSIPVLELRPDLSQSPKLRPAAEVDVEMPVRQRIGVIDGRDFLNRVELFFQHVGSVPENDHALAGIAARAPVVVTLMSAEGIRQSHLRAQEINGAGLA